MIVYFILVCFVDVNDGFDEFVCVKNVDYAGNWRAPLSGLMPSIYPGRFFDTRGVLFSFFPL